VLSQQGASSHVHYGHVRAGQCGKGAARGAGARQQAKKSGRPDIEALPPQWFELDPAAAAAPLGKALRWRYKEGSYWRARERGAWGSCRTLFDAA